MFHRLIKPIKSNSFFIFGGRGTGKSTFLKTYFGEEKPLWIDLLTPQEEDRYSQNPGLLAEQIHSPTCSFKWVVIDEVQKVPRLLDVVHQQIENSPVLFAMTGSSARKLKRGHANLLAGRAFLNFLFPLTFIEMGEAFDLKEALQWGTLPKITQFKTAEEKTAFLNSYALAYLKEEIWAEHVIRQLDPFRKFLEIAAQTNGQIINFSNIARDVGVDTKTVQSYFQILEDTLIGFLLDSFHLSIRKQQRQNPKFYFFDMGVKRALDRTIVQPLLPNTYAYGNAFEHFIILEIHRLNIYGDKNFRFSYLRTKDDAEIDLIVEKPDKSVVLIEIKSSERVDERDTKTLEHFLKDFQKAEGFILSRDSLSRKIGNIKAFHWQEGLKEMGL